MLDHDADGEAGAGIVRVVHVIATVDIIDVDIIRVVPADWPWFNKSKPKAAVLEARISANQHRIAHVEVVPAAKTGPETVVWNSTAASGAEAKRRLCALSGNCLLGAPGRLRRSDCLLVRLLLRLGLLLSFRLGLGLFRGLRLLLLFSRFCLRFLPQGLGLLLLGRRLLFRRLSLFLFFRFSLRLMFCGLGLLLLFRLGFFLLRRPGLFLRFFLACGSRLRASENQKQSSSTDYSDWFHVLSPLHLLLGS